MRGTTFAVAVLLFCVQAHAGTIYNDGGTHTVNEPSADIQVSNATTLNVQTGAMIMGAGATGTTLAADGILAEGAGTLVNVSGGSITGGQPSPPLDLDGAEGINLAFGASLAVTGGLITAGFGGTTSAVNDQPSPSPSSVSISGGTFVGCLGVTYSSIAGGSVSISGGTFTFNNVNIAPLVFGVGAEIFFNNNPGTAMISGGTFNGFPSGALTIDTSGSNSQATISGGLFNGTVNLRGLSSGDATVVSGGVLNGAAILNLGNGATVSFLGNSLKFTNGVLTGVLQDGNSLDVPISLIAGNTKVSVTSTKIVFTGGAVPEPGSILMMLLGLAAVAALECRGRLAA